MEVILKKDIKGIGKKGEVKKVKEGYAKNYLFPKNLAVLATNAELNKLNSSVANEEKKEAKRKSQAQERAKKLEGKTVSLKVKSGKDGKIFGSVSSKDVEAAVKKSFNMDVDKKKITMEVDHIKSTGDYTAEIKFHPEVKATVNLKIESE